MHSFAGTWGRGLSSAAALEERRQQAQQEAEKTLDKEAIAAITETQAAVKAIGGGEGSSAMKLLQRAAYVSIAGRAMREPTGFEMSTS